MKRKLYLWTYAKYKKKEQDAWDAGFRWGAYIGLLSGFFIWMMTAVAISVMYGGW